VVVAGAASMIADRAHDGKVMRLPAQVRRCSQRVTPGALVAADRKGPRYSATASGFMSQVSIWDAPPESQIMMVDFAAGDRRGRMHRRLHSPDSPEEARPPATKKVRRSRGHDHQGTLHAMAPPTSTVLLRSSQLLDGELGDGSFQSCRLTGISGNAGDFRIISRQPVHVHSGKGSTQRPRTPGFLLEAVDGPILVTRQAHVLDSIRACIPYSTTTAARPKATSFHPCHSSQACFRRN